MGKYIKKFDTHSDYEDFIETEDFIKPNVSYCVDNTEVHYNSTQTLFALEIESGRFISFYFQNGVLYANTDDGSSALWVLDSDGVVVDNISYSIADRAPILAQINEHYGTSFTGWSDNEIGLSIGGTMPNWNAYEKIEIESSNLYAVGDDTNGYFFGTLNGESFELISNGSSSWLAERDGKIKGTGAPASVENLYINAFVSRGIEVTTITQKVEEYEIGAQVPNWSEYNII